MDLSDFGHGGVVSDDGVDFVFEALFLGEELLDGEDVFLCDKGGNLGEAVVCDELRNEFDDVLGLCSGEGEIFLVVEEGSEMEDMFADGFEDCRVGGEEVMVEFEFDGRRGDFCCEVIGFGEDDRSGEGVVWGKVRELTVLMEGFAGYRFGAIAEFGEFTHDARGVLEGREDRKGGIAGGDMLLKEVEYVCERGGGFEDDTGGLGESGILVFVPRSDAELGLFFEANDPNEEIRSA